MSLNLIPGFNEYIGVGGGKPVYPGDLFPEAWKGIGWKTNDDGTVMSLLDAGKELKKDTEDWWKWFFKQLDKYLYLILAGLGMVTITVVAVKL